MAKKITYRGVVGVTEGELEFSKMLMSGKSQTEAAKIAFPNAKNPKTAGAQLYARPKVKKLVRVLMQFGKLNENSQTGMNVIKDILESPESKPTALFNAAAYLHEKFGYGAVPPSEWTLDFKKKERSEQAFAIIEQLAEDKDIAASVRQKAAQYLHETFGEAKPDAKNQGEVDIDSLDGQELEDYIEELKTEIKQLKIQTFDPSKVFKKTKNATPAITAGAGL